jgi:methyl-accepting chemotaxis protein
MATDASNSLGNIKSSIDRTASIAEGLLENSTKQKQAMEEFSKGTKYIAQVIESNSETAEESASVSEELAAQAQSLKHMIEYFKITR